MKYRIIILLATLCFFYMKGNAQVASVEKSIWGAQIGIHPLAVYNETTLTNSIALRSELGFGFAWSGSSYYNNSAQWAVMPCIDLEPRYYYNLKKRIEKGKRTNGNSGNFLSLYIGVMSGCGITSDNVKLFPSISAIPMWGIRRSMGMHFNFETAFGVGYGWTFQEYTFIDFYTNTPATYHITENGVAFGLRIAFGYYF